MRAEGHDADADLQVLRRAALSTMFASLLQKGRPTVWNAARAVPEIRGPRGGLAVLTLLGVLLGGSLAGCSPRGESDGDAGAAAPGQSVPRETVASPFEVRETGEGVEVRDGGALVLFYQRTLKDYEGQYARSNYVHP